jgi:hypothetical protein
MPLARWPNEAFASIEDVETGSPIDVRGNLGDREGAFFYAGDRPERWVTEPDPWVHGYWFWDWSDERSQIATIDPARKHIKLKPPHHKFGYRKGQWYYGYNLLPELDSPGEWYLDRPTGTLLFWPPSARGEAVVSVLQALISLDHVSRVSFDGFELAASRTTAMTVTNSAHVDIANINVRNAGGWGIRVAKSTFVTVRDSTVANAGDGGIYLEGGDRATLAASGNRIESSVIHHCALWNRTQRPGIALAGVGHQISHNVIYDLPTEAIHLSGNDHTIEFNDIHDVCTEANDAGAIYGGRDWTMRGTIIRNNFLHDIFGYKARGCMGVYLDDMLSGITVTDNVFYRVKRAVFIGGGRDNTVTNNLFVDCDPAIHVDARALNWAAPAVGGVMKLRLADMPYTRSPWRERYPALLNLLADSPGAPKGNIIERNVRWRGRWVDIEATSRPFVQLGPNFVDGDPLLLDVEHMKLGMRDNSPAFRMGFKRIPLENVGLHR